MTSNIPDAERHCPNCQSDLGQDPLSTKRVCLNCETSYTPAELAEVATDGGRHSSLDKGGRSAEVEYNRGFRGIYVA